MKKFLQAFNVPTLSSLLKKKNNPKPKGKEGKEVLYIHSNVPTFGHNSFRQNPSAASYSHKKQFLALPSPLYSFWLIFSNLDLLSGYTSYPIYCNTLVVCLCLTLLSLGLLFLPICALSPKILCHFFEILTCFVFMHE